MVSKRETVLPISGRNFFRYQKGIIVSASRFVFYYVNLRPQSIIPDTEKARQWAVEKHGATHFSQFSFHRLNPDKTPGDYKVGNFYCTIRAKNGRDTINKDLFDFIIHLLQVSFRLDGVAPCRLIYLGRHQIGLTIPATCFGIDHGGEILPYLYKAALKLMSDTSDQLHFDHWDIQMSGRVDIENKLLAPGTYAVPFLLGETVLDSEFSAINISREPRVAPVAAWARIAKWDQRIHQEILQKLTIAANYALQQEAGRTKNPTRHRLEPLMQMSDPLFGVSACSPDHLFDAVSCARKLVAVICQRRIFEFRRRHAHTFVRGNLNGKARNGGGLLDALRILVAHDYLRECPRVTTNHRSKPPSPWYVANPGIYDISTT